MALIRHDTQTCQKEYYHKKAAISISKNGRFHFNKTASNILQLSPKCSIVFFQDDEKKDNWFVQKEEQVQFKPYVGFEVAMTRKSGYHFHCTTLMRRIIKSLPITGEGSLTFIMAQQPTQEGGNLFAVITHRNN